VEQLQLNLWGQLAAADENPANADLSIIWDSLDRSILNLPHLSQLETAGEAIVRIANIQLARSNHLLPWSKINQLSQKPLESTSESDPILPFDAFDFLVRQSSWVDFSALIDPQIEFGRSRNKNDWEDKSSPQESEITLEELLDLAGSESPSNWSDRIRQYVSIPGFQDILFVDLCRTLQMPQVEVWLGLLLGNLDISIAQINKDDFYSCEGIIINKNVDSSTSLY